VSWHTHHHAAARTEVLQSVPQAPLGDIVRESTDGKAIASAYREYGYTLSEIAKHLGMYYSTVSRRPGWHETES